MYSEEEAVGGCYRGWGVRCGRWKGRGAWVMDYESWIVING